MNGVVVRINTGKAYLFIMGENEIQHFAHVKDFLRRRDFDSAREGTPVEFTPIQTTKGWRAVEVKQCS